MICATANPSLDAVFEVDRLVPGAIHRSSDLVRVAGGKGLNVARAARTLGAEPLAVALLGGPGGRWIAARLAELGIALEAVAAPGDTRSCLSVFSAEAGSLTEFYEAGDPIDAATWDAFAAAVGRACAPGGGAGWLVLTGSLPPGAPDTAYAGLARAAAAAGTPCAVDASGAAFAAVLGAGPEVVKVNAHEAAELLGGAAAADDAAAAGAEAVGADAAGDDAAAVARAERRAALAAADALRTRASGGDRDRDRVAIVTCGGAGAALAGPGLRLTGAVAATARYPVGSGDAFLAGLLTARERGGDWAAAFAAALGAGAANAEVPGPGLLDRGRAEALAERAAVVHEDAPDADVRS